MSFSARLEVYWSKTFHISVRKPSILADFCMFFWPPEGQYWADFREKLFRSGPNPHEF